MGKLQNIVDTINLVAKKTRRGLIKPNDIKLSIQAAERDLYDELLNTFRLTGILPKKLEAFKVRYVDKNFDADGLIDLTADASPLKEILSCLIEYTSGDGQRRADLVKVDSDWAKKEIDKILDPKAPEKPLSDYIDSSTLAGDGVSNSIVLPETFLKVLGGYTTVSGERFESFEVSSKKWASRKLSDLIPDKDNPDDPLYRNINESTISLTSGKGSLPADFIKATLGYVTVDGGDYDVKFVSPEAFKRRNLSDLVKDGEINQHLQEVTESIALTNGVGSLPDYFVKDRGVFYLEEGGDSYEGIILDSDEFLDRKNSDILTPSTEEPIARITGGTIEVAPNTVSSIKLIFYKYPTDKTPIATVYGDTIEVAPSSLASIKVRYYKHPVIERAIFKVEGNTLYVAPTPDAGEDFNVTYISFPTKRRPMIRTIGSKIYALPKGVTNSTEVTYVKKLTVSEYAWSTSGRDITFDSGSSTDTEFDEDSIDEIIAKALKYLGLSIQASDIAQLENIKDNHDAKKDI